METRLPIVLFTPYFSAKSPERQLELDTCLRNNSSSSIITAIFLLIDDGREVPFRDPKIEVIRTKSRPTYRQWIELTRNLDSPSISVLANSDIYFDETLTKLRQINFLPNSLVALSRHEVVNGEIFPHPDSHWSQDVWAIHAGAQPPQTLLEALEIPLGVPRCDNKVAYVFGVHGWRVFNPVRYINAFHLHETNQRDYDKKGNLTVIGGVAYVNPSEALNEPSTLEIDIWAKNTQAIRTVRLNKSLDSWATETSEEPPLANRTIKSGVKESLLCSEVAVHPVPVNSSVMRRISSGSATEKVTKLCTAQVLDLDGSQFNSGLGPIYKSHELLTYGKIIFDYLHRFQVYRHRDRLLYLDWLQPNSARTINIGSMQTFSGDDRLSADKLLPIFIPPLMNTDPILITQRPTHQSDCHFWQYPANTEEQAYENHRSIQFGRNIDKHARIVHTYLGLPWATYIDKKYIPTELVTYLKPRLSGFSKLAFAYGYTLAVHTVCQQIHWRRLKELFQELGITDLHLSHCEKSIVRDSNNHSFRVHSWPLIAVNVENPTLSEGIQRGKSISEKQFLASFIGAHMSHYRSNVRLRLKELSEIVTNDDILIDVQNEWHFNKVVYQEQVQEKPLSPIQRKEYRAATIRYNEILSDTIFSICPEGAGPNSLRVWESIAVGSIPVIIADDWLPPKFPGSPLTIDDCCLFVRSSDLDNIFHVLRTIKRANIKAMQASCLELYEHIRTLQTFPVRST